MRRGEQGFVLVCVLWVLAILTVIAIGFSRRALLDRAAATYTFDHAKAMQMARGAVSRGIIELQNKGVYDFINKQEQRTSYAQQWAKPVNLLEDQNIFTDTKKEDTADDVCEYIIEDESAKISINGAPEKVLENIKGLSRSVVRKIMVRRMGGTEDQPLAQPFQTIEELRTFKGISDKDWLGARRKVGLCTLLTCWGDDKVNVNTASREVLECIPDLPSNVIDAIVNYRAGADGQLCTADDQDFKTLEEIPQKVGAGGNAMSTLQTYCKVDSQLFTITGVATRRNGKIRATCVATILLGSPAGESDSVMYRDNGPGASIFKWREEILEP